MACLLSDCSNQNSLSLREKSVVYCSEASPATFNPQQSTTSISSDASAKLLFDTLVESETDAKEIKPALALSWTVSQDQLHYVMDLRPHVQFGSNKLFTPTRDFNADDVIFTFNRQRDTQHPFHAVGTGHYPFFYANNLDYIIKDLKKITPLQVEFILKKPTPGFLGLLAMDFSSIQSQEYAQNLLQNKSSFDLFPIGTGPFQLERYETDTFIRYHAKTNYWRKAPEIQTLVFAITQEPSLRLARLLTGECDIMAQPLPSQSQIIESHKDLTLDRQPSFNVAYWAFNTLRPPFNQLKVRQALSYAISRHAIINSVYNNAAIIAKSPLPPNMFGATTPLPFIQQDREKSKALLKEAAWDPDFVVDIWAMPVQRPYNPDAKKMAELMHHDLAAVGVKSRIITYKWEVFLDKVSKGQHQTVLLGWRADNGEPDDFLTPLLSCNGRMNGTNRAFWCDQEFDHFIDQARQAPKEQKLQLYKEAQDRFKSQLPWLPIAHAEQLIAYRKNIQHLTFTKTGGINFSQISKSKEKE